MEVVIESVVTKRLGAPPVAAGFLRRLDVAGIVDVLCPPDPRADLTHGQVIEVLVANRLTSPAPLFRVGDWACEWAVEEVFGIEAELLNDDRLARALDAIAPHLDRLCACQKTHPSWWGWCTGGVERGCSGHLMSAPAG